MEQRLGEMLNTAAKLTQKTCKEVETKNMQYIASMFTTTIPYYAKNGPHVASMADPLTELLSDPKYRNVCDEAAFFVWAARTDSYIPDPQFVERVARVAESKPLSGRLTSSIWIEQFEPKQKKDRSALLGQLPAPDEPEVAHPQAIQRDLEDASDGDIQRIMRGTTRQYAKDVRAGRR
jgi:hypothetical protein